MSIFRNIPQPEQKAGAYYIRSYDQIITEGGLVMAYSTNPSLIITRRNGTALCSWGFIDTYTATTTIVDYVQILSVWHKVKY